LTPSGDDFILGIIALQSLAGRDLTGLHEIIRDYENPFSRTILEDACEGCFSEPLLALMTHLAYGIACRMRSRPFSVLEAHLVGTPSPVCFMPFIMRYSDVKTGSTDIFCKTLLLTMFI